MRGGVKGGNVEGRDGSVSKHQPAFVKESGDRDRQIREILVPEQFPAEIGGTGFLTGDFGIRLGFVVFPAVAVEVKHPAPKQPPNAAGARGLFFDHLRQFIEVQPLFAFQHHETSFVSQGNVQFGGAAFHAGIECDMPGDVFDRAALLNLRPQENFKISAAQKGCILLLGTL